MLFSSYPHSLLFLSINPNNLLTSSFALKGCVANTTGYCFPFESDLEIGSVDCSENNVCDPDKNEVTLEDGGLVVVVTNPDCPREGESCLLPKEVDVEDCIQPTDGTCQCVSKSCSTRLLEVQTRRLGKGLGTKRDWSVEIDEEDH